jgi:glycosyltransferase involved in cell wall biosynthesis
VEELNLPTLLIVTRDHENFIGELFESVESELSFLRKVICVDTGSFDKTVDVIQSWSPDMEVVRIFLNRGSSTLDALQAAQKFVDTDYIIGISGDDVFAPKFGKEITKIFSKAEKPGVVNFELIKVDSSLNPIGRRIPKWSGNFKSNRLRLLCGNPGTAPGAIIPWRYLVELLEWQDPPKTLIEDYWIWWVLLGRVSFESNVNAQILYRQHQHNLSKAVEDKNYATSIGLCLALAWRNAKSPLEKLASTILWLRWGRHFNVRLFPWIFIGFFQYLRSSQVTT